MKGKIPAEAISETAFHNSLNKDQRVIFDLLTNNIGKVFKAEELLNALNFNGHPKKINLDNLIRTLKEQISHHNKGLEVVVDSENFNKTFSLKKNEHQH